jgi:hypothetical protein
MRSARARLRAIRYRTLCGYMCRIEAKLFGLRLTFSDSWRPLQSNCSARSFSRFIGPAVWGPNPTPMVGLHRDSRQTQTAKDGTYVNVKASVALRRMLDSAPKRGPYILTRADGRPWHTAKNDKAMGKAWRKVMKAAGMYRADYLSDTREDDTLKGERLHLNDVRGTSVTLVSEAGCTIQEVVSITGHTMQSATRILEKYMARTSAISDTAILKFENATATDFANRLQTG